MPGLTTASDTTVKTAEIRVNVGDYNNSNNNNNVQRHYLLPPVRQHLSRHEADNDNEICKFRVVPSSPRQEDDDSNFVHLVHVPANHVGQQFSSLMVPVGFTETVAVGGLDKGHVNRSCASFYHYEADQRCKSELKINSPVFRPVGFGQTVTCYGHNTTLRRHRSTVEYQPKLIPTRFADTCYMLPKRQSTTYVSYLDVRGPGDQLNRKWYASSVEVVPRTVSNVLVGRFRWLADDADGSWEQDDEEDGDEWLTMTHDDRASSGFLSEEEVEDVADGVKVTVSHPEPGSESHRRRLLNNSYRAKLVVGTN